jgi:integrase
MTKRLMEIIQEELDPALWPTRLSPHVLRHTYGCLNTIGSELNLDGALGLRSLQQAMAHESLETTAMYLGDVADFLAAYRTLAGVDQTVDGILDWINKQTG